MITRNEAGVEASISTWEKSGFKAALRVTLGVSPQARRQARLGLLVALL
jgi:hypothetical protein